MVGPQILTDPADEEAAGDHILGQDLVPVPEIGVVVVGEEAVEDVVLIHAVVLVAVLVPVAVLVADHPEIAVAGVVTVVLRNLPTSTMVMDAMKEAEVDHGIGIELFNIDDLPCSLKNSRVMLPSISHIALEIFHRWLTFNRLLSV